MFDVTEDYFALTKKFLNKKIVSCHFTNGKKHNLILKEERPQTAKRNPVFIRMIDTQRVYSVTSVRTLEKLKTKEKFIPEGKLLNHRTS